MSTGIASCRRVFFPEFESTFDPPRVGWNDGGGKAVPMILQARGNAKFVIVGI